MISPFERFISPNFSPSVIRFDITKDNDDIDILKGLDQRVLLNIKTAVYVPIFSEGLKSMEADLYSLNLDDSQPTALTGILSLFDRSSSNEDTNLFLFDSSFDFRSSEIPKSDTLFGINIFLNIEGMNKPILHRQHIFSTVIPIDYINQGK